MPSVCECGSVILACKFVAHSRGDVAVIAIERLHRVREIEHISDPVKVRIRDDHQGSACPLEAS
jgi:hypothetical protein